MESRGWVAGVVLGWEVGWFGQEKVMGSNGSWLRRALVLPFLPRTKAASSLLILRTSTSSCSGDRDRDMERELECLGERESLHDDLRESLERERDIDREPECDSRLGEAERDNLPRGEEDLERGMAERGLRSTWSKSGAGPKAEKS